MIRGLVRIVAVAALLLITASLGGCGISVSVGEESELASSSSSDNRNAMQVQADWRRYIDRASPRVRPRALVDLVNSSAGYYLRYGLQVADNWYKEEQRRGQSVSLQEIKETIDKGAQAQASLIKAHRRMIRYAMLRIQEDHYLSDDLLISVQAHVSHYRLVYEEVFNPTTETDDRYKERLLELQSAGASRADELKSVLDNLR